MRLSLRNACVLWFLACALGLGALTAYSQRPGVTAGSPTGRPAGLTATGGLELYVAVHPQCGCTASTLRELARILPRASREVTTRVLLRTLPLDRAADERARFREGANLALVRALRTAEILDDPDGRTARALGATTSGHCVLLDADETPLFRGGITPGRGHEGASAGGSALLARLRDEPTPVHTTPTYGCSL